MASIIPQLASDANNLSRSLSKASNVINNPLNSVSKAADGATSTLQNINLTVAKIDNAALQSISKITTGSIIPLNTPALQGQLDGIIQAPLKSASAEVMASINEQVQATIKPVVNVMNQVNKAVSLITTSIAEFSRIPSIFAKKSPLAAAQAIKSLVCKGINFLANFNLSAYLSWPPKLPTGLINFSLRKFINKLVRKIEEKIFKFIHNLIEQIKQKIIAIIKKYAAMIASLIDTLLNLFNCNPGDKIPSPGKKTPLPGISGGASGSGFNFSVAGRIGI